MYNYAYMTHNYTKAEKPKNHVSNKVSCSIVGARGYSGLETARLLLNHPNANLTHCFATSEFQLSHYLSSPLAKSVVCLKDSQIFDNLTEVVFLATPAEVSLELAPKILAAGKKVIDLSGAFRLKKSDYLKWYGFNHTDEALLSSAQYGLCPWVGAKSESLIANPGCFATAITMALIPLLKDNLIFEENIAIDAKSGATGAGRKAAENLLFTEVDGECLPYKVGRHQHYPEIVETIELFSGKTIDAHFTTSLLPIRRGIIAGIYANLKKGKSLADVTNAFNEAYQSYPLVRHGPIIEVPQLVSLKKVVGTANTHISYQVDGQKIYIFSCIDNLLKGAASQAVENFNRILDLPKLTGLSQLEVLL